MKTRMTLTTEYRIKFSLISGLLFAILMTIWDVLFSTMTISWGAFFFNFIFFGLFNGLLMTYMVNRSTKEMMQKIQISLLKDETVELEGPANLFRGRVKSVGGKLMLTNERLIFKAHKLNIPSAEIQFQIQEIKAAVPRKNAFFVDNGLRITDSSDRNFDFVVYERDKWIENLRQVS